MPNWITGKRRELSEALESIATTHPEIPDVLDLPMIVLAEAGSDFITRSEFGGYDLTFRATYYARPGDNAVMVEAADEYAAAVLDLDLDAAVSIEPYQTVITSDGQPVYTVPAIITL